MGRRVIVKKNVSEYRKIDKMSYSDLSLYNKSTIKFKKKVIDKEDIEQEESEAMTLGSLVESLVVDELTGSKDTQENFGLLHTVKPTGQLLSFCEYLFLQKEGTMEEKMLAAYEEVKKANGGKLRDKFETFVEKFSQNGSDYFEFLTDSKGKPIITLEDLEKAEKVKKSLLSAPNTFEVLSKCNYFKYPIEFELEGVPFKCELDMFIKDDANKIIYPKDLKITAFVDDFVYNGFLKLNYYLQAAVYKEALKQAFPEYFIADFEFIVGCSQNAAAPLLYSVPEELHEKCLYGFNLGKRRYKGVYEILEEIDIRKEANCWNMSLTNFSNNGKIQIDLDVESSS